LSTFGQWEFTSDREATIAAYARTERGGKAKAWASCSSWVRRARLTTDWPTRARRSAGTIRRKV